MANKARQAHMATSNHVLGFLDDPTLPEFEADQLSINSTPPSSPELDYDNMNKEEKQLRMQVILNAQGFLELDLNERELTYIPSEVFSLPRLECLLLHGNQLSNLPSSMARLHRLRHLGVSQNALISLPDTLSNCVHLSELDLSYNSLKDLPRQLNLLRSIRVLKLGYNKFETLPPVVCELESLRTLELPGNKLWHLPIEFQNLANVRQLNLAENIFEQLPIALCGLKPLEALDFHGNKVISLPADMEKLKYIRELNFSANRLEVIPYVISNLKSLHSLDLSHNRLKNVPSRLGRLPQLRIILLQGNSISSVPSHLPLVEYLNLSNNRLFNFSVARMRHLQYINVNSNYLENVPLGVYNLSQLEVLKLNDNRISYISQDIGLLKKLRILDLGNNKLTSLPAVINELERLETFNIRGNRIESRKKQAQEEQYFYPTLEMIQKKKEQEFLAQQRAIQRGENFNNLTRDLIDSEDDGEIFYDDDYRQRKHRNILRRTSSRKSKHYRRPFFFYKRRRKPGSMRYRPHTRPVATFTPKTTAKARDRPPLNYQLKSNSLPMYYARHRMPHIKKQWMQKPNNTRPVVFKDDEGLTNKHSLSVQVDDQIKPSNMLGSRSSPAGKAESYKFEELPSTSRAVHSSGAPRKSKSKGKGKMSSVRSNAATVNGSVGDDLSLGEQDFQFQPITVADDRLMGVANEVEQLLNKQLLNPIVKPRSVFKKGINENGTLRTLNGLTSSDLHALNKSQNSPNSNQSMLDSLYAAENSEIGEDQETIMLNDDVFMRRPIAVGGRKSPLFIKSRVDVFRVTPAGGQFKSSSDPSIKIYFPVKALSRSTSVMLQIEKVDVEVLRYLCKDTPELDNIIAVGHIVRVGLSNHDNFNEQVTLTIPSPKNTTKPRAKGGTRGKLHILTYMDDNTCTPSTSNWKMYKGYITLYSWHFSGKGAVLMKSRCRQKACRAMDALLRFADTQ